MLTQDAVYAQDCKILYNGNGRNRCCFPYMRPSLWVVNFSIVLLAVVGSSNYTTNYCHMERGEYFHDLRKSRSAINEKRNETCLPCGYMKRTSLSKYVNKYDVSQCELVISTVFFKGYDDFMPLTDGYDDLPDNCFFVFTDSMSRYNVSRGYTHIYVNISSYDIPYDDGARLSKIFKIIPQRVFKNLRWHVHLAGKCTLRRNYVWLLDELRRSNHSGIIAERHVKRIDVYEEGEEVIKLKRANPKIVKKQLQDYHSQGYPKDNGLLDSEFLFRDFASTNIQVFSCVWFDEINRGSRRDQLSFNYVIWKLKLEVKYYPYGYFARSRRHRYKDLVPN